jgi:ABC-type multidrug transport system ATPase subunit
VWGVQVMLAMKQLAKLGHTVVAAIHQPRSRIFELFDDLLLLTSGCCVYSGPADAALAHFEMLGHACPAHYNPAEFLSDLISPDQSSMEARAESEARITNLVNNTPSMSRLLLPLSGLVLQEKHKKPGDMRVAGRLAKADHTYCCLLVGCILCTARLMTFQHSE